MDGYYDWKKTNVKRYMGPVSLQFDNFIVAVSILVYILHTSQGTRE
jgi:hypothetical protein